MYTGIKRYCTFNANLIECKLDSTPIHARHEMRVKYVVWLVLALLAGLFLTLLTRRTTPLAANSNTGGGYVLSYFGDVRNGLPTDPAHWQQVSARLVPGEVVDRSGSSGAKLSAVPPLLKNGGRVTIRWSGVPADPSKHGREDWVGLYCPCSAHSQDFIDYFWTNRSQTHSRGYGSTEVTLYSLRTECELRYFSSSITGTELLAVSGVVGFVGGAKAPLHAHLALTGRSTEMRVQWTSGDTATPTVFYGSTESQLTRKAVGVSRTYNNSDMCGPPANLSRFFIPPGHMHDVLLTGLEPGKRYFYQCGSDTIRSAVRSFRAQLPAGSRTPFKFVAFGDMDTTPAAVTTAELVRQEVEGGASFVLCVGDLSYALGVAYRWDVWMSLTESFASRAPFMISVGNNDQNTMVGGAKDPSHVPDNGFHPPWGNYGHDSGGECGVPLYRRFHMPDHGHAPWWYSFNYGLVHFTILSTEHDFTRGSEQRRWLEQDLRSVDRRVTPWLIVGAHRPMYSSELYPVDAKVCDGVRSSLEDLFHQYRVELAVWGHYHAYQRTCAVYQNQCSPGGTVHIVVGTGGAMKDSAGIRQDSWSEHFEAEYGYGHVSVVNHTALLWEFVRDSDKTVSDSVWVKKSNDFHIML